MRLYCAVTIVGLLFGLVGCAIVVNDPRLEEHSNFFPKRIYDIQEDSYSARHAPAGLKYRAYSAVGYDLANTMWLVTEDKNIVVIDTLGEWNSTQEVIGEYKRFLGITSEKLPFKAIIYTHNHIDHTGGVQGYLAMADRPVCPPESTSRVSRTNTYKTRSNCVEIIAQAKVVDAVINTGTKVGTMINTRSGYMYGNFLINGPVNSGIGPKVNIGSASFRMPSVTFTQELKLTVDGLQLQLIYVPSETDDELIVFLPDSKNSKGAVGNRSSWKGPGLLFSAEVIQGPSFPNLYSLRGTSYRSAQTWYESVDVLRSLDSWCMIPSHGPPLCGPDNVQLLLKNFRDAVQFAHDQAVRFINKGYTPAELAASIQSLPEYLIAELTSLKSGLPDDDMNPVNYLQPFYGSVPQSVKAAFVGYLGWYTADPVELLPNPPVDLSQRYITQMGGRDIVLAAARTALVKGQTTEDKEELTWAAQLATHLIKVNNFDREARTVKALAYLRLAEPTSRIATEGLSKVDIRSMNPNWRNWFLTSTEELVLPDNIYFPPASATGLTSPSIVCQLPLSAWVKAWSLRLKAEVTVQKETMMSMGFLFLADAAQQDSQNQAYGLKIRKAIAEFSDYGSINARQLAPKVDVAISLKRTDLCDLLNNEAEQVANLYKQQIANPQASFIHSILPTPTVDPFVVLLESAIKSGSVTLLEGTLDDVKEFFSYFDAKLIVSPPLSVR